MLVQPIDFFHETAAPIPFDSTPDFLTGYKTDTRRLFRLTRQRIQDGVAVYMGPAAAVYELKLPIFRQPLFFS